MGNQILVVLGGSRIGFYLLVSDSDESPRKIVSAEALLGDNCANCADAASRDGNGEMHLAGPCAENNLCMVASKD